jgi:hypothetical protein
MSENSEIWQQFSGSALANVVMMFGYGLYKFIEGHCKHSRCSCNNRCFKCSVDNDEIQRQITKREDDIRSLQNLQTLQFGDQKKIPEGHQETV